MRGDVRSGFRICFDNSEYVCVIGACYTTLARALPCSHSLLCIIGLVGALNGFGETLVVT